MFSVLRTNLMHLRSSRQRASSLVALGALLTSGTALAHTGSFAHEHGESTVSLMQPFLHPMTGIDHVWAAVMIGCWAALVSRQSRLSGQSIKSGRTLWVWPALFAMMLFVGAMSSIMWTQEKGELVNVSWLMEAGVAASVIIMGWMVAYRVGGTRSSTHLLLALLVGGLGALHGAVHGLELAAAWPSASIRTQLGGATAITASTWLMHGVGIFIGHVIGTRRTQASMRLSQGLGWLSASFGSALLASVLLGSAIH